MKIKILYLTGLFAFLLGCNKDTVVPIPSPGATFINETNPLTKKSQLLMEGVYRVTSGSEKYGDYIVLKWNHKGVLLTCNNGLHFIMQAGHLDSVVFVQGYWRDGYSDATGL